MRAAGSPAVRQTVSVRCGGQLCRSEPYTYALREKAWLTIGRNGFCFRTAVCVEGGCRLRTWRAAGRSVGLRTKYASAKFVGTKRLRPSAVRRSPSAADRTPPDGSCGLCGRRTSRRFGILDSGPLPQARGRAPCATTPPIVRWRGRRKGCAARITAAGGAAHRRRRRGRAHRKVR